MVDLIVNSKKVNSYDGVELDCKITTPENFQAIVILVHGSFNQDKDGNLVNMIGSVSNIAGICNKEKNVFGLMPHPERAIEELLGSIDGVNMLKGFLQ